jgi:hypothetical protein
MVRALLSFLSRDGKKQSQQQQAGPMRRAKLYDFRQSSKRCSTCEDLSRLEVRIAAALRNARNLYRAVTRVIESTQLARYDHPEWRANEVRGFKLFQANAPGTLWNYQ